MIDIPNAQLIQDQHFDSQIVQLQYAVTEVAGGQYIVCTDFSALDLSFNDEVLGGMCSGDASSMDSRELV